MWVTKLILRHEDCVIGGRCRRFHITSIGSPMTSFKEEEQAFFHHLGTLIGEEDKIKMALEDFKEDPSIHNFEVEGHSISFLAELPSIPAVHQNPKVFFIKPVIIDNKGFETWEVASWDEQILKEFTVNLQKEYSEFKLIFTESRPINKVPSQDLPSLTKSQKKAIDLATKRNYYDFPRKIELKDLASELGISLSTFREHLRKAEKKVMPGLVRNLN